MILESLLWTSLGLVAYCYVVYPSLLAAWHWLARRGPSLPIAPPAPADAGSFPRVSLIIAAYKEESVILERIQNALMMDYPADRIEILIGCDGNEDHTGDLVRTVQDSRVRLMQFPVRRGKPSVLNDCLEQTSGEIIAFSDANTFWDRDALHKLVRHFADPTVGGVCGQLLLTDPHTGANVDGLYWRYENFMKKCEGRLGMLLGANGAIYAIRREHWEPIPANSIIDDFLIGMRIHLRRQRLLFDEDAVAHEESAPSIDAEFHRRARIGAGGFQSLCWLLPLLNPLRGRIAFAFWSHKVLRWFCPFFLLMAFVANAALVAGLDRWTSMEPVLDSSLYHWLFIGQCVFYTVAIAGRTLPGSGPTIRFARLASMFLNMNLALAAGFWRWIGQRQSGAWKRTVRSQELRHTSASAHVD